MNKSFRVTWVFAAFAILVSGIWAGPARAAQHADQVALKATEFAFDPAKANASPGKVTFVVTNAGNFPHGFTIEGMEAENSIPRIDPGQTARITVDLSKRVYVFYCPLEGHREQGMEGDLAVGVAAKPAAEKKPDQPRRGYSGY